MTHHRVVLLSGDGIGPEITAVLLNHLLILIDVDTFFG